MYEKNTVGTATYIYGPYGILAKRTLTNESHTFYYHTDHLGSTRLVTGENRNIVTAAQYEPFGKSTVTGSESYLYTGKEKDSTGLSYYGARYYDSELGRFITRDLLAGKRIIPHILDTCVSGAFSTVTRLFHVIGHEDVHILDMLDDVLDMLGLSFSPRDMYIKIVERARVHHWALSAQVFDRK